MSANAGKCDLILNTVPVKHEPKDYLPLLNETGKLINLGIFANPFTIDQGEDGKMFGSLIGGIANT